MYEFEQPVPDMRTIDDVLDYIRTRAATTEPGQWITLSQVFITRLRNSATRPAPSSIAPHPGIRWPSAPALMPR